MSEKEIFEKLFSLIPLSNDTNGAVSACLVRDGKVIAEGISNNEGVHAEYALLKKLEADREIVNENDVVYTTVEPCGKRTAGGRGETMGDCTTNLIKAGVKRVVFAASDPHASDDTRHKFLGASASLEKTKDQEITRKAIETFNSTCENPANRLPLE